jgi:alpha-galactosidase
MGPSEAMVRATVDAMVEGGFVAAGYKWLNLDDGIVEVNRDANGDLVADKTGFPNGFAPVAAYVKANGMQFGVYTDRGTQT